MLVKLDHFPKHRGENSKKPLKQTPRNHMMSQMMIYIMVMVCFWFFDGRRKICTNQKISIKIIYQPNTSFKTLDPFPFKLNQVTGIQIPKPGHTMGSGPVLTGVPVDDTTQIAHTILGMIFVKTYEQLLKQSQNMFGFGFGLLSVTLISWLKSDVC